jgi:hypothetical protein
VTFKGAVIQAAVECGASDYGSFSALHPSVFGLFATERLLSMESSIIIDHMHGPEGADET